MLHAKFQVSWCKGLVLHVKIFMPNIFAHYWKEAVGSFLQFLISINVSLADIRCSILIRGQISFFRKSIFFKFLG